jgi:hypothetical protein
VDQEFLPKQIKLENNNEKKKEYIIS